MNYNPKKTEKEKCCAIYLLYKDARCDMNILDESVGAEIGKEITS